MPHDFLKEDLSESAKYLLNLLVSHPDTRYPHTGEQAYTLKIINELKNFYIDNKLIISALLTGLDANINQLTKQALKESGNKKPYVEVIKQYKDKQNLLKNEGLDAYITSLNI